MIKQKNIQMSFSDPYIAKRKIKTQFFDEINLIIDWDKIDSIIKQYYQKGQSVAGRPSYSGLLLFKMCLLQTWYNLSDYELEERVNDCLSFMKFLGLTLEDDVPDHSVISRFRTQLTSKNGFKPLLNAINKQLEKHNVIIKTGVLLDASVTDTLRKPKGKTTYEVADDRKEEEQSREDQEKETASLKLIKQTKPGVDTEARWLKKGGKLHYGYKKHQLTDKEGLVLNIVTTAANESDIKHLKDVLEGVKLAENTPLYADKGYASKKNRTKLKEKKLKDRIQHKAVKNKALTKWEIFFNSLISKIRYKVERTFGSQKLLFGAGLARYIGLEKTHTQHLMEAIAYNLYRSPGIIMSSREN